jgi:hypothetical protein
MLAATPPPDPRATVFMWLGIIVVLIFIAYAAYMWFKRWMNDEEEPSHTGFTLSDLRELHRQGKMSDEEFEQTKANMLAGAKKMADRMPDVIPRRLTKPPAGDGQTPPPVP